MTASRARNACILKTTRRTGARTFPQSASLAVLGAILFCLPPQLQRARAQAAPSQQIQDQSASRAQAVTHPEALSGLWEAPDGNGGVIGIHLQLTTTLLPLATTFVGAQSWGDLVVGLYQNREASSRPAIENGFNDSPRGGVRYEDGHLTLHYPNYDLDLRRVPGDGWSGRFHREGFDSTVTLRRPGSEIESGQSWIVGTWRSGWMSTNMDTFTCLHVFEPAPGVFVGWSDSLNTMASTHATSDLNLPPYATERYGQLVKVSVSDAGGASIVLNAHNAVCCPHPFQARSSADKNLMIADGQADLNHLAHQSYWAKVPGDSCLASYP